MAGLRGWLWRPVDPTIMFPMLISLVFSSQMIFSYMPEWGPFACLISIALSCGVVVSIPAQNARGPGFDSRQSRLLRARHCTIFFPLSWLRSFLIRYSVTLFRYVIPLQCLLIVSTKNADTHWGLYNRIIHWKEVIKSDRDWNKYKIYWIPLNG